MVDREFHYGVTRRLRVLRRQVGANIHACRLSKNVSLEKLSQRSGLSVALIDRLEMGGGEVELRDIISLAFALHISVDELLSGAGTGQRASIA